MSKVGPAETASARNGSGPLRVAIRRYFFYGWLFRDASTGSDLERAAALRHNRHSAQWLPTYLWRWSVVGFLALVVETWTERALESVVISAMLAIGLVGVVVFLAVTALAWAILRARHSP
jgi:hypothetical protein